MDDLWSRAKILAQGTATKSKILSSSTISDVVSHTAKVSKDIFEEASLKACQLKAVALKQTDVIPIKSISDVISPTLFSTPAIKPVVVRHSDSTQFGITTELIETVNCFSMTTFQDFNLDDKFDSVDVATTLSNTRMDLTKWQENHAALILSSSKQMSKIRYNLCPRIMSERKFWKIYFTLVDTYISPYEKQYVKNIDLQSKDQICDDAQKSDSLFQIAPTFKPAEIQNNISDASAAEEELDKFLLGDFDESDENQDNDGGSCIDEFGNIDQIDAEDKLSSAKQSI